MPGAPMPALLNNKSRRPKTSLALANSARTASGSPTSVGTASIWLPEGAALLAVRSSSTARRPASTTEYPAPCSARLTARPMPLPAPVTKAILLSAMFHPFAVHGGLLQGQQQKEQAIVGRMHYRRGFCRSGAVTHPPERRAGACDQDCVPPGVAVLLEMQQPKCRGREQDARGGAERP